MSEYRLRRGPVLGLLLIVAVVGTLLIGRGAVRPQVSALGLVTVPKAYAGSTYAFDGVVCLRATALAAHVTGVSAGISGGVRTRLVGRPAGAPPAFAFPVASGAGTSLVGLHLSSGQEECERVLVSGAAAGEQRAGPVTVRLSYGPFGLLRAAVRVTPQVLLQVTGTGIDPRTTA